MNWRLKRRTSADWKPQQLFNLSVNVNTLDDTKVGCVRNDNPNVNTHITHFLQYS